MPNGMYFPEAFGQKLKDADFILDETWQNVQVNAINDPHEWAKLKVPSMKEGVFAREIEAVKRIADYFRQTFLFCPPYSARLSGWAR